MKITLTLLTVLLFGILDGTRDTLLFHYDESVFAKAKNQQFVNPEISWKNKYKDGTLEPKYWGSTTVFAYATDLYHLLKSTQLNLILLLVFYLTIHKARYKWYWSILLFIGIKTIFSLGFHLMWSFL